MAGLIYWVSGARTPGVTQHALVKGPVAVESMDTPVHKYDTPGPPDGTAAGYAACLVVPEPGKAPLTGYKATGQKWWKVPRPETSGPEIWIGLDETQPPRPEDFARERQIAGHLVELPDGNRWLVPTARRWVLSDGEPKWFHGVPTTRTLDEEGRWVDGPVAARFEKLWGYVTAWMEASYKVAAGEKGAYAGFDTAWQCAVIVEALSINYRVGSVEVAFLGLVESGTFLKVMDALCDLNTLEELQGKVDTPSAAASS